MKLIVLIIFPFYAWALQVDENASEIASGDPADADDNTSAIVVEIAPAEESNATEENANPDPEVAKEEENKEARRRKAYFF